MPRVQAGRLYAQKIVFWRDYWRPLASPGSKDAYDYFIFYFSIGHESYVYMD